MRCSHNILKRGYEHARYPFVVCGQEDRCAARRREDAAGRCAGDCKRYYKANLGIKDMQFIIDAANLILEVEID